MWAKVSSFEMGLCDNPICKRCGRLLRRKPQFMFCVSVRPLLHSRHQYLGSFFLDPEDVRTLNIRALWKFAKETGLL
jgi:hypothetical protein